MHLSYWLIGGGTYVLLALILGVVGRNRKMGGWGYFFGSILLTPIVGLILVMGSDPKKRDAGVSAPAM